MSEDKAKPDDATSPGMAPTSSASAPSSSEQSDGQPTHADDLIAELRRNLSDYKDKNLRLLAEMENLRRRTDEEKAAAAKYAVTRFAGDIVNLIDNFQRATGAVPAGAIENNPTLKSLVDGVAMTEREFLNVLERHGIKRISSIGEVFSPHYHQPMMQIANAEVPAGTILNVLQEGYMIGDRVLRAAVVAISEGGPKPGATPPAAGTSSAPIAADEGEPTVRAGSSHECGGDNGTGNDMSGPETQQG